jgi:hypothetical protein
MRSLLLLFTLIPFFMQAQECNCKSSFDWLKTTFEENDAGAPMVLEEKGIASYNEFCDSVRNIAGTINNHVECVSLLNDWTKFFRKGHVGISYSRPKAKSNKDAKSEIKDYNAETYSVDTIELFQKLRNGQQEYGLVGVWDLRYYSVAIVPDTINPKRSYVGVVLKTSKPEWKPGQIKVEFFETDSGNFVNYYMADHSLVKGDYEYSNAKLRTANTHWTRSADYLPENEREQLSLYYTREPLLKKLNDETVLLKLPSFNYTYRKAINELVEKNEKLLNSTKNLIIDLRGNGGGSDNSYSKVLPYIYTNPIKINSLEFRATPLSYASYKQLSKRSLFFRLYFHFNLRKKFKKNMGSYFNRFDDSIKIIDRFEPKEYPRNVYMIVDKDCASSTEQLVLYAEQSSKTTIVGERTFGAIDVSNIVSTKFPNNKYELYYATSRSLRMKYRKIDDIGIDPEITIPDNVPKYKWIQYVEENIIK